MGRVEGKVAIITGAASGLGKGAASLLARERAKVILADINEAGGEEAAEGIRRDGGEAVFMKLDVSSESDWSKVIKKTLAEFSRLDVLVNNAGVELVKEIADTSLEEWRWLMSVNLDGVFLGTKYGIRAMREKGGGSIINMSSVAGIVGTFDDTAAYCASKGGVRLLTKAAALECSKAGHDYNIRVNSIHPGLIRTPMVEGLLENEEIRERLKNIHPIGFIGEPIDVAYVVLYLASDESRLVTGSEMVIDGGWTAH